MKHLSGKHLSRPLASICLGVFVLFAVEGSHASSDSFFGITKEALNRYASTRGLDPKSNDNRTFGFHVEKHGNMARVGVYDRSQVDLVQTHRFGCEFDGVATCWQQASAPGVVYKGFLSKYSLDHQLSAVYDVMAQLKNSGVSSEQFSLLKVWQSSHVIHVRIGFEAAAVEMNYDCDPTQAKLCRPAQSFPDGEP